MTFQIEIDHVNEARRSVQDLPDVNEPDFAKHEPRLEKARELCEKQDFDSLVVIGNGGSITSFRAYLYAFLPEVDIDVRPVTTMDPDFLNRLSRELSSEDTLVMPISKSGSTTGVLEATLYFMKRGHEVLPVTSDNDGALKQIVDKRDLDWIEHPPIGGRFTGLAETALVPALFSGIDIDPIIEGGNEMYEQLKPENNYNAALNVASALYDAENEGFDKIFAPFYSSRMFGYMPLFIQLIHETVAKDGKGPYAAGDLGPEYQHHTNQRIFGGKEDVLTFFFRTETHERENLEIPSDIRDVDLREKKLKEFQGMELGDSLAAEYQGVKNALEEEDMPSITLNLTELSHESAGKLVAFMQYTAFYLAHLYNVNPFTQPDVEKSKNLGFESRFKGLP